jgi:beta-glucosidase/6-phospho-beta-glucosidase/beta-galactosidase
VRLPILTIVAFCWAVASAQAQTIVLSYRAGGMMMEHIHQADQWLHQGVRIEVTDWQMSSAAMQIVYFYRHGGAICYRDSSEWTRAYLQFHQPQANGVAVDDYRGVFVHFMGEEITAMIGPVVVDEFKAIHASEVGISRCV